MSSNKTILLVDDDIDLLENIAFLIKRMGYDVVTAENGEEAVSKYREIKPNLTVMDIKMPKMDGFDAFFKIKQQDGNAKVILITAYMVDQEKYQKAQNMSLIATINKPFTFDDIEDLIRQHV